MRGLLFAFFAGLLVYCVFHLVGFSAGVDAFVRHRADQIWSNRLDLVIAGIVVFCVDWISGVVGEQLNDQNVTRVWVLQQACRAIATIGLTTSIVIAAVSPSGWVGHVGLPFFVLAFAASLTDSFLFWKYKLRRDGRWHSKRVAQIILLHVMALCLLPLIVSSVSSRGYWATFSPAEAIGALVGVLACREFYNRFVPTTVDKNPPAPPPLAHPMTERELADAQMNAYLYLARPEARGNWLTRPFRL